VVPHSRALGVLLRSIIVEREPIYRQQETVQVFASGMFGIAAEQMQHLGDDRLGRAWNSSNFTLKRRPTVTTTSVINAARSASNNRSRGRKPRIDRACPPSQCVE
jgi:hypothetical protein